MAEVGIMRRLAERVRAAGGRALLIGGAVRDRLLGRSTTDFDVEVYGLSADRVAAIAREFGVARDVGKAFGVLEVRAGEETIHLSLPRRESKVAPGHRGFAIDADPTMTPEEAARRRDFTINAIAEDPLTGEVIDPFQGQEDLKRRVLRIVDAQHFREDPLRVLRGAVFAAHFALDVDPASDHAIREVVPSLRELPKERIGEEWRKLLLRPRLPSRGLQLLMEWGVFGVLHPEFVPLPHTPQNPAWHPEGNVWVHTLMAVDEAASIIRAHDSELTTPDSFHVMLSVLCHDLGKAAMTRREGGVWVSRGHDIAALELTQNFLRSLAVSRQTETVVTSLVREHLLPLQVFNARAKGQPMSDGAIRRLARRVHPATIFLLTLVADGDHRGRGPFAASEVGEETSGVGNPALDAGAQLRERALALGVLFGPPAPIISGEDLIRLGLPPGPHFGEILKRAEELRDRADLSRDTILERLEGVTSAEEARERLSKALPILPYYVIR